ncbi:MAG: universal stress protein [Candidatus Mariimomonas ferrooxydans]
MMKNFFKKFEDAMTAGAFAEAGEFNTAREILNERRRILLALTGKKSDIHAFRYALNTSKRIGAGLEILYFSSNAKELISRLKSELGKENIEYSFIHKSGCIEKEILEYTSKNREILFVVVESPDGLNINCRKAGKRITESWKDLKCPLVVVSDLAPAL